MDTNTPTEFPNTCISCDRTSPNGLGGIINTVNLDGKLIFATTCWHCAFDRNINP